MSLQFSNDSTLTMFLAYEVKEGMIVPKTSDFSYFNPLLPITKDQCNEVLQKRAVDADFDLHTLFINLNVKDSEELVRFSNQFGLLYNPIYVEEKFQQTSNITLRQLRLRVGLYSSIYTQEEQFLLSQIPKHGVYLHEYLEEIKRLRIMINLYTALQHKSTAFLNDEARFLLFYENTLDHGHLKPFRELEQQVELQNDLQEIRQLSSDLRFSDLKVQKAEFLALEQKIKIVFQKALQLGFEDTLLEMCIVLLDATFEAALKGVSPKLSFDVDNEPLNSWIFSGLLSAIYFKFFQDFNAQKKFHLCQNSKCHNIYLKKAKNNDYCSATCRNRAKAARNRSRNQQQVLALFEKGFSIEDIKQHVNVEHERIRAWINKANISNDSNDSNYDD